MSTALYPPLRAEREVISDTEGISFDSVRALLRRQRLLVGVCAAGVAAVVVITTLVAGRSYSSEASFAVQGTRSVGSLPGLAAQFGLAVQSVDATQSTEFYVDLIRSKEILAPVAESTYRIRTRGTEVSGDLASFLDIRERDPRLRRDRAVRALRSRLSTGANTKTGVVTLRVSTPHPELAHQVTVRILDRLNAFNLEGRQSRASLERRFTEERLRDAGRELLVAENRLEQFLEANRQPQLPAKLTIERDRLVREIAMRQQIYTSLAQSYEQSKIEEVRDLPVITTISSPEAAVRPDGRGLLKKSVVALILGALTGLVAAYLIERQPGVATA